MSQKWEKEEDIQLVKLIIDSIKTGDNYQNAILHASKGLNNRTYSACYTRWNKISNEENEKEMKALIDLYKENYIMNLRICRVERQLDNLIREMLK